MRTRAFTLIELLVVIAIIAILAAILFPVFAQAKESAKKTAAISHLKQTATAMVMYATDYDDILPLAHSVRANQTHRWTTWHPLPADWFPPADPSGWGAPNIVQEVQLQWANSTYPYMKNSDLWTGPGIPEKPVTADPFATAVKPPKNGAWTYNGLLHTWSMTSVAHPSRLTMVWSGAGKQAYKGRSASNPGLWCSATGPCQFNPNGYPQAGVTNPFSIGATMFWNFNATAWVYTRGMIFAHTDTSAKYLPVGADRSVNGQPSDRDPFVSYSEQGVPAGWWGCYAPGATTGSVQYPCFFRPDSEFNYFGG